MVIGINARVLLLRVLEGLGWYTHEILRRIVQQHPEHTFIFFVDRRFKEEFRYGPNVKVVVIPFRTFHPVVWHPFFQYIMPLLAWSYRCKALVSLEGFVPVKAPMPTISILHDLGFLHVPEQMKWAMRNYYPWIFRRIAKGVDVLGTVSEFSRRDIAKQFHIPEEKIAVVHNSVRESFKPVPSNIRIETRNVFTDSRPYLVFVGVLQPRKNVVRMLRAYDLYRQRTGSDVKLVIAGRKGWIETGVDAVLKGMSYSNDVVFTGYLNDDQLVNVIGSASAMLFVPLFEGFGVPALEALKVGTPLITSQNSPMQDIAQDAAVYVDPYSEESIAEGIEKMMNDNDLQQRCVELGLQRAEEYSWDASAEKIWKMIVDVTKDKA